MPGKPLAWAVLCKDGEVHTTDENSCLFLDQVQAWDEAEVLDTDEACGPHRVVKLYAAVRRAQ